MIFRKLARVSSPDLKKNSTYLDHIDEFNNIWVSLAEPEELDLPGAVDPPGDDLDGVLLARGAVDAPPADSVGTVPQEALVQLHVVLHKER